MLRKDARFFLSCLAASCIGSSVQAQVTGSVTLSDVRITLTDLAPDDGIAPELIWTDSTNYLTLSRFTQDPPRQPPFGNFPSYTLAYQHRDVGPGDWDATKQLSGDASVVSMDAGTFAITFHALLGVEDHADASNLRSFTLTPFTSLTVQAKVSLQANAAIPDGALYQSPIGNLATSVGGAGGNVNLMLEGAGYASSGIGTGLPIASSGPTTLSRADEDWVFATINNTHDAAATGTLSLSTTFWARTVRPEVPEAATWAQMLLGMAALGGLAGWRRRRA